MATFADWVEGARIRTLPAAAAPVLVGTGAAYALGEGSVVRALLAAGVALALQIGVNYANDYSDGVRGTDDVRTGPPRLTGSGAARPGTVKAAAFASFGVAAVLGLLLCAVAGTWWLLGVGALCVLAAWYYTGGRNPYGYRGLGEVGVFVFFGLVATLGTTWTQALRLSWPAVAGAVGIGLIACALLMVNNIRDIPTDTVTGKRTLAVRLGDTAARRVYVAMIALPVVLALVVALAHPLALLTLAVVPGVVIAARRVLGGAQGRELIVVLRDTGLIELGYGLLLGAGLAL
ncbi:1,4-dihydroxy-2-naphthoate polyprenyltransferase [Georgenia sp. 311]|uniref:1,4-dihydroxy-2-naphthoate octaprenyltransferase n=1 Tax=Georgenia wutianyii TaxID=2585135 RepID=A0ABX5VRN8_9MICO|nr:MULTISPECIES: 1,4-dihydroxy-2-naphthoate polyprenyltransferase [Georgenia]QDB80306.1 1,4-dihydroxy-2-naphthoate polyprenyltransferase [Georgenia wutianyii]TNC19922.1 1,4-dihydroxy-2-naphthoate polyprenyltransferase [Georgenia sp. 311]